MSTKRMMVGRAFWVIFLILLFSVNGVFYFARSSESVKLKETDVIFSQVQTDISSMNYDAALQALDQYYSEKSRKGNDVIDYLRARAYFGKADYQEAARIFEKVRAEKPLYLKSYEYLYFYGLSLYMCKEYETTRQIMGAALLVSPKDPRNNKLKAVLNEIGT